jgi:hypothetical protein
MPAPDIDLVFGIQIAKALAIAFTLREIAE